MAITLGQRSLTNMIGLHPDLIRVIKRGALIASPAQDFSILEGVRSKEGMMVNWGKGRTVAQLAKFGIPASYAKPNEAKVTWLNNPFMSNHRKMADGYGHAFDAVPYPIDWNDIGRFKLLVSLWKSAAHQEGVKIICGADWSKPDYPHVELGA